MGGLVIAAAGYAAGAGIAGSVMLPLSIAKALPLVGWMAGSALGSAMAGPKNVQGPQQPLMDLKITGTEYGQCIPYVRGAARIAGQMWWNTDRRPTTTTTTESSGGGKGGGGGTETTTSTTTYDMDCLIGLTDNEIAGIARIWNNGALIWTSSSGATAGSIAASEASNAWTDLRIYLGSLTQLPDPTYEAAVGATDAIAYRGRSYVFIEGLKLGQGGQVPNLTFEVVADGGVTPDAPTIGAATKNADETEVSVAFTPPAEDGGLTITGYTVTSVPAGYTATGASSPIVITPAIGTTYTYTVHATNAAGDSPESEESNAVKLRTKSYASFDPSAKNADVVLNGNSATCTLDNFHQVNTDKFSPQTILYAEFTLGLGASGYNTAIGINTSTANFDNGSHPGYDNGGAPNGPGYGISGDGRLWHAGATTPNSPLQGPPSFVAPEVISMLFDSSDGTIRIWEDGVERRGQGSLDPITGIPAGSYCLALAVRKNGPTSSQVTFNAGASAWAYPAIPAAAGALGWFSWVE